MTGNPYTAAWKMFWLQCAKAALLAPETRVPLLKKGKERAKSMTWDVSYEDHWKPIVAELLAGKEVARV